MVDFTGIPLTQPPGLPTHGSTAAKAQQGTPEERRTAEQFEAVFLTEMLQPMFEGLSTDGIGGGGRGEEMFRPLLIEQYADAIAKRGGVGVAANILSELTRMHAAGAAASPDAANASAAEAEAHASAAARAGWSPSLNEEADGSDR